MPLSVFSQVPLPKPGPVFRDDLLPKIWISLPKDSFKLLIDSVYEDLEMQARFVFNSGTVQDTVYKVGFSIRGSASRDAAKKSFKVSFNSFKGKKSFYGLEKMNLNAEADDPSLIRSKLCWDLFRTMGVPAPRANHVLLYINEVFQGVYLNIEQVDEEFVALRFGNKGGNLYKCQWPADLTYVSQNPDDYKDSVNEILPYTLKTNKKANDFSDIAHFIDVLNNTPIKNLEIELNKVINVNNLLKTIVLNVFIGAGDGPFFNQNNYYLYKNTSTGKFEFISYDMNDTFGIDFFDIDWPNRSVYSWAPDSSGFPVFYQVLSVPAFRKQYTLLFKELLNKIESAGYLEPRINQLKSLYERYISLDINYSKQFGWKPDDFQKSFYEKLPQGHLKTPLIPYIHSRATSAKRQLSTK